MNLTFRNAKYDDAKFIYDLRFRVEDKNSYLTGGDIDFNTHCLFWSKYSPYYTIALCSGKEVGFYGFVEGDFRYAVVPEKRGKGIGIQLIRNAIDRHNLRQARVVNSNYASIKCFQKAGFKVTYEADHEYIVVNLI